MSFDALFDQMEDVKRPPIQQKDWMKQKRMELVTDDTFDRVVQECIDSGLYAIDLETEGLDSRVFPPEEGSVRTTEHAIVGICLSPDGEVGYYVPLRHKEGENCSLDKVEAGMFRLILSESKAVFHNAKFDQEFLQWAGGTEPWGEWDDVKKWEDTLILAYLDDCRRKSKGLKALSKQLLGFEMIELKELFDEDAVKAGELDFSTLDPSWEPVVWYAASDAICTYQLYHQLIHRILEPASEKGGSQKTHGGTQKTIYQLEKMCVPATRWMERSRIPIDKEKVGELIRIGNREWFQCLVTVYEQASDLLGRDIRPAHYRMLMGDYEGQEEHEFDPEIVVPSYKDRVDAASTVASKGRFDPTEVSDTGKTRIKTISKKVPHLVNSKQSENVDFPVVYDLNSQQQLGLLFRELGVPGLTVTENSGQIKTSKDEIQRVIDAAGEQFPFMGSVNRFREVQKALSSNLLPLYTDSDPRDNTLKVDFHAYRVETGRFSTKGRTKGKALHGGTTFNLHSTPSTYDPRRPECLQRIRECFIARPGRMLVAIDYAGVELRIVTNLSREPKWLAEFFRCSSCSMTFDRGDGQSTPEPPPARCPRCGSDKIGDLHTLTALSIYGQDANKKPEWKHLRGNGKATNFALCYGGGGNAVVRATNCDKEEGWRIKNQFDRAYKGLSKWWETTRNFARKYEYVMTAFGRWYRLPDIKHEMRGFRAKAERNAINGPIQGTSADITKLAMALIYKECKKRGWLDKVGMLVTIHDELVFDIDLDILEEAIEVFSKLMAEDTVRRLKWPVPLTVDVEMGFDWTVPWDLNEMRFGEVRFKGNKKIKSPEKLEDPNEWDSLPSWPEELRPYFKKASELPPAPSGDDGEGSDSGGDSNQATKPPSKVEAMKDIRASLNQVRVPKLERGEPYIHRVAKSALTVGMVENLARLINECANGGTHLLRVVVRETGDIVLGEEDDILVNPAQWAILTRHYGL